MCDEWSDDYVAFRDWAYKNGYGDGLEIHRVDPNGDYEPNNYIFLTKEAHAKITAKWRGRNSKDSNRHTK